MKNEIYWYVLFCERMVFDRDGDFGSTTDMR